MSATGESLILVEVALGALDALDPLVAETVLAISLRDWSLISGSS